ncbi:MAG: elongation factor G [Kiritimatiellia bacterium]|jgi:elongation factor G|nr:elongation factor G [Kiritimatiellia bacterium]MDP6847651.1 elongation factor G [Kiritimatiellia bacterium]
MKGIPVSNVRNVAVMGHTGSGKTSLIDAILYKLGLNDRLGSVDSGSSMADYTDEEKSRKITISSKPFQGTYKTQSGKTIGLVATDTPGYMDFFGQIIAASRAVDAAIIAVDASSGVQVGTRRAWKCCDQQGISARAIVITCLDKDNTDYASTLEGIRAAFGPSCAPVVIPLPDCSGVVDVIAAKDVPAEVAGIAEEAKGSLVELAAETDDTLIEKFLGGEELSPEEISKGLENAVASGGLIPVFACMAQKDVGVAEFLEGCARLLPSPEAHTISDAEGEEIKTDASAPFSAIVWRTVNDPFVGQLSFLRVLGGTLKSDSEITNASKGQNERVSSLLVVNGKKQSQVDEATAGDIVAIPKLKFTKVGDTLCAVGQKVICNAIPFPKPVMFQAVTAQTQADEDKIGTALTRVCDEDPTLSVDRNRETKEMVLQGLGDVHIDVAVEMMKSRSNVKVNLSTPKVPYRETVTGQGEGHYKHKKQSGGRGQFGEVYLRVEKKSPAEEEWFVNAIVGGAIPGNFIPAVQKGLLERMTEGAVAGYTVQDVKVTLYDGSFHTVDSSEVAFKIAGSRALKEAMLEAKPVLLEPIMTVKITLPENAMGDINGDLNHKRGRIMGMEAADGMQVITAEVPQAELFRYSAELRSMTAGQGSFEMDFNRYEVVPANVAQKIIASAEVEEEE